LSSEPVKRDCPITYIVARIIYEQMLFEAARRGLDPVSGKKNGLLPTAIQLSVNEMNKH
jgi:hypothetical protein